MMATIENASSQAKNERIDNNVNLILTGDIMLGGEFPALKDERNLGWEYPFRKVKPLFEETDIIFGNLECPLSRDGPVADKNCILYAPPDSVSALKYLNYNLVSLGNNHINDYGEGGLIKTIEILKNEEILLFGAGRNLKEANREVIIERNGLKICFLGYTTSEEHVQSIIAGQNTAGCVPYDFSKIKYDIDRVRNKSDIISISLHWGFQNYLYPSPQQKELAHKIIDAGAHIIIGHHPHVIQGFERYKHGIIFYSLGNFFFPNFHKKSGIPYKFEWQEENNKSIIARCKISKVKVEEIEILVSFMNMDYQLEILDGKDKEEAILRLGKISKDISMDNYNNFWRTYNRKKTKELLQKRMRQMGIKGCIRQAFSMRSIKHIVKLLITHIKQNIYI